MATVEANSVCMVRLEASYPGDYLPMYAISMQLTVMETVDQGVKRFGEMEVDHANILLILNEDYHPLLQYKKVDETV